MATRYPVVTIMNDTSREEYNHFPDLSFEGGSSDEMVQHSALGLSHFSLICNSLTGDFQVDLWVSCRSILDRCLIVQSQPRNGNSDNLLFAFVDNNMAPQNVGTPEIQKYIRDGTGYLVFEHLYDVADDYTMHAATGTGQWFNGRRRHCWNHSLLVIYCFQPWVNIVPCTLPPPTAPPHHCPPSAICAVCGRL